MGEVPEKCPVEGDFLIVEYFSKIKEEEVEENSIQHVNENVECVEHWEWGRPHLNFWLLLAFEGEYHDSVFVGYGRKWLSRMAFLEEFI